METRGDPVRWLSPGSDAPEDLRRVLSSAAGDGGGAGAMASLAAKLPGVAGVAGAAGAKVSGSVAGAAAKKAILSWKLAVWIAGAAAAGGAATNLFVLAPHGPPAITAPAQGARAPGGQTGSLETGSLAAASPETTVPETGSLAAAAPETTVPETGSLAAAPETGSPSPVVPAASVGAAFPGGGERETATLDRPAPARRPGVEKAAAAPAGAEPRAPDSLGAEARVLLEARRDMAKDPRKALRATEAHDSAFADGALAEEREVLRIEALIRLNKGDQAAVVAAAFRARYPQSSHLARIERLLRARR